MRKPFAVLAAIAAAAALAGCKPNGQPAASQA